MPKISIAVHGRNDNYIDHYLDRVRLGLRSIQRALNGIDYEIVFLDYNPPKDRPLLSECFPNSEYPRIKHVVFSHEEHLEFIDHQIRGGAVVTFKDVELSADTIYSFNMISLFAQILSIKHSIGDYILATGADNIFPTQFGKFIRKLHPNILYRTWIYRTNKDVNINELIDIPFSKFDELSDHRRVTDSMVRSFKINKKMLLFPKKTCNRILSTAGNFMLMDRNSWKEIKPFLATINHRLAFGDNQGIFHALSYGRKVKCANFPVFNIHSRTVPKYVSYDAYANFIIKKDNKILYDQREEIEKWGKYKKWAGKSRLKSNREYFLKTNYKNRFKEVKNIFKSILPSKFNL